MKINLTSNTIADNARAAQNRATSGAATSIARLSSGERITSASDDVASLSIATNIRTRLSGLRASVSNVNQADSMLQIADQALNQMTTILQRQKELAVRAGSGALSDGERGFLDQEFQQLTAEITRLANATNFNNVRFFNGSEESALTLAQTNAIAANAILGTSGLQVGGGGNATASATPIQAFNRLTGASMAGTAAAGRLQLVDSTGAVLANGAYDDVNESVYGSFSDFKFSDVVYGTTGRGYATLTATLNGVEYTGRVVSAATTRVTLTNGNTRLNMNLGTVNLTDGGRTEFSLNSIQDAFKNTVIARTNVLNDVSFAGTRLNGAVGTSTRSIANIRLTTGEMVDIGKFEYLGNRNAANSNTIAVTINGTRFIADNVRDLISGGNLQFRDEARIQVLSINLAGLTTNITNIRTRPQDREQFIAALNTAFAEVRSSMDFAIEDASISINIGKITPKSLYADQEASVATAKDASNANNLLDYALKRVNSMRANIGAVISRLGFAGSVLATSIQNQDAARASLTDTDVASESSAFAQFIVKADFSSFAIAQANNLPETLLDLLSDQ